MFPIVLCAVMCQASETELRPPNIVLIISDDQAWTDYGFMGHPQIETPQLDRLAARSVVFRRGYVPTALCRPSLMTLITGRYAHQHGITGNDPAADELTRPSDEYQQLRAELIARIDHHSTLPQLLAARGYVSFQSGKWWEGSYRRGGFTHGMTRGFPHPGGRHGDEGLRIGREGLQPITQFIDEALQREQPFFVWYAPFLPHTPHTPPETLLKKYERFELSPPIAKYYAMCEWFDETCGQLIAHLESRGIRDDTLIVYVADNGWIQHPQRNGYAARSKQTPYEGGVRTPMMFCWPARWLPAERPEVVSSIDVVPTILAAAGASRPDDLPGLNLCDYLITGDRIERAAIFGEGFAHDIADIHDIEASLLYRWCIEGPWKLLLTYDGQVHRYASTHPRTEKRPQLYHLQEDPHELQNRAAQHADVVARLAQRLDDWYPVRRRTVIQRFEEP